MSDPIDDPTSAVGSLTFVGTATTVLRLGPFTLLTDPNFCAADNARTSARGCGPGG